jgi:hypothetical protein
MLACLWSPVYMHFSAKQQKTSLFVLRTRNCVNFAERASLAAKLLFFPTEWRQLRNEPWYTPATASIGSQFIYRILFRWENLTRCAFLLRCSHLEYATVLCKIFTIGPDERTVWSFTILHMRKSITHTGRQSERVRNFRACTAYRRQQRKSASTRSMLCQLLRHADRKNACTRRPTAQYQNTQNNAATTASYNNGDKWIGRRTSGPQFGFQFFNTVH